jgi:hypothetical protein
MNDVAWQATEAERQACAKIEQRPNDSDNAPKDQQGPSKFAEWVHKLSLKLLLFEVKGWPAMLR